jgi:hypothetical protein
LDIDITQFRFDADHLILATPINGKLSAFRTTVSYWTSAGTLEFIWLEDEDTDDEFIDFFNEIMNPNELFLIKKYYINEKDVYNSFLELKESLEERYRLKLSKYNSDKLDEISFFYIEQKLQ